MERDRLAALRGSETSSLAAELTQTRSELAASQNLLQRVKADAAAASNKVRLSMLGHRSRIRCERPGRRRGGTLVAADDLSGWARIQGRIPPRSLLGEKLVVVKVKILTRGLDWGSEGLGAASRQLLCGWGPPAWRSCCSIA
jgi:hypothetical protein